MQPGAHLTFARFAYEACIIEGENYVVPNCSGTIIFCICSGASKSLSLGHSTAPKSKGNLAVVYQCFRNIKELKLFEIRFNILYL